MEKVPALPSEQIDSYQRSLQSPFPRQCGFFFHPIAGDVSDVSDRAQASLPEDHPMAGTYPVFRWEEVVVCIQGKEDLMWH